MSAGPRPRPEAADPRDLALDRATVLRYLGYKPGITQMTSRAEAEVTAGLAQVGGLLAPQAALVDCAVVTGRAPGAVCTAAGHEWQSHALARLLHGAEVVTVVAATVGAGVDEAIRAAFAGGEYALATVLDAAGSAAVQAWAALLRSRLTGRAAAWELTPTELYSPGYGDWNINDLHPLLGLTEAARIGITATPAGYLLPQKTVVGVFGWVPAAGDRRAPVGCRVCTLRDCTYRTAEGEG